MLDYSSDRPDSRRRRPKYKPVTEPVLGVSLRPNDAFAKKLPSTPVEIQDVLLKVTIPKRTGRKRKRGSNGPFIDSPLSPEMKHNITAPDLLQRLRDNVGKYAIEAIGSITRAHRFRGVPDVQLLGHEVAMLREIRARAMTPDLRLLRNFHVNLNPGAQGITEFPRPPQFIPPIQPGRHSSQVVIDSAPRPMTDMRPDSRLDNSPTCEAQDMMSHPEASSSTTTPAVFEPAAQSKQRANELVGPLDPTPRATPNSRRRRSTIRGTDKTPPRLKPILNDLMALFEERPIISRRVAEIRLRHHGRNNVVGAIDHIGTQHEEGPWIDTVIKPGVDPFNDPALRFYQTVRSTVRGSKAARGVQGHEWNYEFDGESMGAAIRHWQLCDVKDPALINLIQTKDIRDCCDCENWGWYQNGTLTKIRVIMHDKMKRLARGVPLPTANQYQIVAALPDRISTDTRCELKRETHGLILYELAKEIRKEALTGASFGPRWRTAGQPERPAEGEATEDTAPADPSGLRHADGADLEDDNTVSESAVA